MANMAEVLERLRGTPRSVAEHRSDQVRRWISEVGAALLAIEGWLTPLLKSGDLFKTDLEIDVQEENGETYSVRGLRLSFPFDKKTIDILPESYRVAEVVASSKARYLGLQGRVHLRCGPHRALLLRKVGAGGSDWFFLLDNGEERPFSEEGFGDVVLSLVGVGESRNA